MIPTISPANVLHLRNAQLVDVRLPEEYVGELGHVATSILKTLGPELEEFLRTGQTEDTVVFICRSGARSALATNMAIAQGFKNCFNMEGGMLEWNRLAMPVVRS